MEEDLHWSVTTETTKMVMDVHLTAKYNKDISAQVEVQYQLISVRR